MECKELPEEYSDSQSISDNPQSIKEFIDAHPKKNFQFFNRVNGKVCVRPY